MYGMYFIQESNTKFDKGLLFVFLFEFYVSKGSRPKKDTFLANMSIKAFIPPPLGLNGHNSKNLIFICLYFSIFLKLETSENSKQFLIS